MKKIFVLFCFSFFLISNTYSRDLADIKLDIFKMAQAYKGQIDIDGSKQKKIEALVDELLSLVPNLSMEEKAIRAIGTWNQVWGPYAFDDSDRMPPGIDVDKIYQFISPKGFYYNFAEYKVFGARLKTYLRGKYNIESDRVRVEFTETGLIRKKEAIDYANAGEKLERGELKKFKFPSNLPPAGVKGGLIEIYADQDIRINYGVVGDDIDSPAIFVMKRVE